MTRVPMTRVFTSAHSPCNKGTIAPSTLSCWSAGPAAPSLGSASSASTASLCNSTQAFPLRSVVRRTVASDTSIIRKWPVSSAA